MTNKKPQIRFNLSIFEDIKRFCDDHGTSRDFELVVTPLDESERYVQHILSVWKNAKNDVSSRFSLAQYPQSRQIYFYTY